MERVLGSGSSCMKAIDFSKSHDKSYDFFEIPVRMNAEMEFVHWMFLCREFHGIYLTFFLQFCAHM